MLISRTIATLVLAVERSNRVWSRIIIIVKKEYGVNQEYSPLGWGALNIIKVLVAQDRMAKHSVNCNSNLACLISYELKR